MCILYLATATKKMQKAADLTTVVQRGVLYTLSVTQTVSVLQREALTESEQTVGRPADSIRIR